LYGIQDDVILYWAHHEKLCLIDGKTAFMGGLDLCYGRWDTHNHPIADAHPADIKETVFPGQDYNNGRILDFQDVVHWENNQLDRQSSSRMGWSDVSLCLSGPVVEDLQRHFVERWNYIYDQKYAVRKDARFAKLALPPQRPVSSSGHGNMPWSHHQQELAQGHATQQPHGFYSPPPPAPGSGYPPPPGGQPYFPPPPGQAHGQPHSSTPGYGQQTTQSRAGLPTDLRGLKDEVSNFGKLLRGQVHRYQDQFMPPSTGAPPVRPNQAKVSCQIVRSVSKWSIGAATTEASIAEAYATVIRESEHFVYIENQFFITATGDAQKPVKNLIGAAIVERILRAARAGQKYKMIVVIPSVPGFAGDLHEEGSLGTRAIMEFQYNSINRGGHSILEKIAQEGFNPMEYIRFYNLRNYDRINVSGVMKAAELASGVTYGQAQQQYDTATTAPKVKAFDTTSAYPQYQQYAPSHTTHNGRWDTVSSCYMLGGEDIRNVPWEHGGAVSEIDAFVSEELYVHSKVSAGVFPIAVFPNGSVDPE
jgi:phospholipase D1/2